MPRPCPRRPPRWLTRRAVEHRAERFHQLHICWVEQVRVHAQRRDPLQRRQLRATQSRDRCDPQRLPGAASSVCADGGGTHAHATCWASRLVPWTVWLTCVGFPSASHPENTRTSQTPRRRSRTVATVAEGCSCRDAKGMTRVSELPYRPSTTEFARQRWLERSQGAGSPRCLRRSCRSSSHGATSPPGSHARSRNHRGSGSPAR